VVVHTVASALDDHQAFPEEEDAYRVEAVEVEIATFLEAGKHHVENYSVKQELLQTLTDVADVKVVAVGVQPS